MKKPRKARNANRGTLQHIEDAFSDLELSDQAKMLETLTSLHRWATRERNRKPQTDAEAAGRADYFAAAGAADPLPNPVPQKDSTTPATACHVVGPSVLVMDAPQQLMSDEYREESKQ